MKLLLALALTLSTTLSFASTISSMSKCTIDLYLSNPWKSEYTLKDSRVSGQAALERLSSTRVNAKTDVEKDVLGVERYKTITKTTTLETRGDDVNSCSGVTSANKVEICTTDAAATVCETFCKFEWHGVDCR
jgi:hypothetical protein